MARKINWGVLGCANIAKIRLIPGLLQASNANLYAIASRDKKKSDETAQMFQAEKSYGSYEELLADPKVEAVYIPLPNSMHCEWVEKAARAGKHILCEKPLALNAKEAEHMFDVASECGVILMEAFAFRHAPLVNRVKETIKSGTIGNVKYIESHLTDVITDMENIRMDRSLGGGSFYDMACYNISTVSFLLDFKNPDGVKAFTVMDPERNVDLSNTAILYYKEGIQAVSYSSLDSYARGYYAIVGDKGRIEVPANFNCRYTQKFTVTTSGIVSNVEILDEEKNEITVFCPDNYMMEVEQFGRCITEGEKPLVSREETVLNASILDRLLLEGGYMG